MKHLLGISILLPLAAATAGCSGDDAPAHCTPRSGEICTIAGLDDAAFDGDHGPAVEAHLYLPMDVTPGPDGNLYVVDWNNHRIRRIDHATGTIDTVAGTGNLGDGPPGPALMSDFNHPTTLLFDPLGRMLIAAWHNSRIKRVDLSAGTIEDICGTGRRAYSGDDGPAAMADLDLPASLAYGPSGDLFVMDQANQVIRRIDAEDRIHRFAGRCIIGTCAEGESPSPCAGTDKMACGLAGDPMACMKPCSPSFGGDGSDALDARIAQPFGQAADPAGRIAFDADGNLFFADTRNHRVRRIAPDGTVTTVAGTGEPGRGGDGGPATEAGLSNPVDVAIAQDGTLYIADTMNSCVRAVSTDGVIRTVAGLCGTRGFEGDGGPPAMALLDRPYGIALDDGGDLYIADTHNHRIRVIMH